MEFDIGLFRVYPLKSFNNQTLHNFKNAYFDSFEQKYPFVYIRVNKALIKMLFDAT